MKQKLLCAIAICLPLFVFCQNGKGDSGILWTAGLTWNQVLNKAKKENKYIFVDAYATWCKPCKQMDKEVYTVDSVGEYINGNYISVKVQMDVTKNDDASIKSWYKSARNIAGQYGVIAFPSLLFFTPQGELAAKEVGYKEAPVLISIARNAKDPSKQYYVLLKNYKKGKLDDAAKRYLINTAKQIKDTVNYRALRDSYLTHLNILPKEKLYTKENIEFIASIINKRKQALFKMFYPDGKAVDSVMQKEGYAKNVTDQVIMKEKIAVIMNAGINNKTEPDWKSLYSSIAKDYDGAFADRNIMEAKLIWYYGAGDIFRWATTLSDKIEKYGTDTTSRGADFMLNNQAFIIWRDLGATVKPEDKIIAELNRVCRWMEGPARRYGSATGFRLQQWPLILDTYANLLYKVGRTTEALNWQQLAVSKGHDLGTDEDAMETIENNFNLMKKGEPTWPIQNK